MRRLVELHRPGRAFEHVPAAAPSFGALRRLVEEALLSVIGRSLTRVPRVRVFTSDGTRDDLVGLFLGQRIMGRTLNRLLSDLWPGGHCVAINDVSCWSRPLHELIHAELLQPWLEKFGPSVGGIDIYAFVGAYASTPFGVHKDDEDSYLFNLGPGDKVAHVWPREEGRRLFPEHEMHFRAYDYQNALSAAQTVVMRPGDGLLIYRGSLHVLESPEYTVMIGAAPYIVEFDKVLAAALCRLTREYAKALPAPTYGTELETLQALVELVVWQKGAPLDQLPDSLRAAVGSEVLVLKSNNYVRGVNACANAVPTDLAAHRFALAHQDYVQSIRVGEALHVFARGAEVVMPPTEGIVAIFKRICLSSFTVGDLQQAAFDQITQRAIEGIVTWLLDVGAIDVVATE